MKGKGKKGRDSSDDECPLQFLDFEPLDVIRFCPRFSQSEYFCHFVCLTVTRIQLTDLLNITVAGRTEDEGVGIEDLDVLQSEVESMLVNVTRRSIAIESEIDALVNWQESQIKPKKGTSPAKGVSDVTPSKRKLSSRSRDPESGEKPSKRSRISAAASAADAGPSGLKSNDSSSCSSTSSSASTASSASSPASSSCATTTPASKSSHAAAGKDSKVKSKSKNLTSKSQSQQYDDMYLQKNDIPDRFWSFIEPYCAPVKPENVKFLEDMIKSYEDDSLNEYYRVPNRGKHYSTKWGNATDSLNDTTTGSTSPAKTPAKEKADRKKGEPLILSLVMMM
jgi:transcriptional adapter 3